MATKITGSVVVSNSAGTLVFFPAAIPIGTAVEAVIGSAEDRPLTVSDIVATAPAPVAEDPPVGEETIRRAAIPPKIVHRPMR